MDAAFFYPTHLSQEIKSFTFTVTLNDKGKWKELDRTSNKSASVSAGGLKLSANGSAGKTYQKSIEFGAHLSTTDGTHNTETTYCYDHDSKIPLIMRDWNLLGGENSVSQ